MAEPAEKLYRAEYAKSGRASCKKCGESIAKDSLRLALMVQVPRGGAWAGGGGEGGREGGRRADHSAPHRRRGQVGPPLPAQGRSAGPLSAAGASAAYF